MTTKTMMTNEVKNNLLNHVRSKVIHLYNPETEFLVSDSLQNELDIDHKGFYIGIIKDGQEIAQQGFMSEDANDLLKSVDVVIKDLFEKLNNTNISKDIVRKSTFHLEIIKECKYIVNPLEWDEDKDGIYFMWGQDYSAMYLPYQVKLKNQNKIDLMDQLCCFEAKLPANLWRLPEGMCFRIESESI